jgi:hypothetical protein
VVNQQIRNLLCDAAHIFMDNPALVSESAPEEQRWGYHQIPTVSRLPSGDIVVTVNDGPDGDTPYGVFRPAFILTDDGATWTTWTPDDLMLSISNFIVSEVYDGEFLSVPMAPSMYFAERLSKFPEPAATVDVYGKVHYYRASECADLVQLNIATLPATRWTPKRRRWFHEEVTLGYTRRARAYARGVVEQKRFIYRGSPDHAMRRLSSSSHA